MSEQSPLNPAQPPRSQPPISQPPAVPPAGYPQQPADGWRDAYDKERKKFRIASAAAAVAAVIAVVALVWGVAQNQSSSTVAGGSGGQFAGGAGQFPGDGQFPGYGAPGGQMGPGGQDGQGGPGMGRIAEQLLNADGTVNTTAVAELKSQSESGTAPPLQVFAQIIPREVQHGDLTQAQADQILAALGVSAATTTTSPKAAASPSASAASGA